MRGPQRVRSAQRSSRPLKVCSDPLASAEVISRGPGVAFHLEFLPNVAGKPQGLGDAGIETFRSTPYTSCAREAGQNSRDAVKHAPVLLRLNLHEVARRDVPLLDDLTEALRMCLSTARDEKTRDFFLNALRVAESDVIPVFEIADFNTHGLVGPPDDENSPFVALVKGDGVTNKLDLASGGSFGIGKNATFAVSDLQTVVYSTVYTADGTERFAAQARVRLISHRSPEGTPRAAEGYWGEAGFKAIENPAAVPSWMSRTEVGTSIFAVGFRREENWASRMAQSIVANFFIAIDRDEMRFEIAEGTYKINQATLPSFLEDPVLQAAADSLGQGSELDRAKMLYRATKAESTQKFDIAIDGLGSFRLHLLIDSNLPRRVHIVRNGIYITDELRRFGEAFRGFAGTREFIALLEPIAGSNGLQLSSQALKSMENPEHNSFSPERITDPQKRAFAARAVKKLAKRVREIIKAEAAVEDAGETALDEMAKYFAELDETKPADDAAEDDPDSYTFSQATQAKRRRRKPRSSISGGSGGGAAGQRRGKGNRGGGRGENEGDKTGGATGGNSRPLSLSEVRNVIIGVERGRSRRIMFTPNESGAARVRVYSAGLTDETPLELAATAEARAPAELKVNVAAGERTCVDVHFLHPFEGPIEVVADLIAGEES